MTVSFLRCISSGILKPGSKAAKTLKWVPFLDKKTYRRSLQRSHLISIQEARKGLLTSSEWEKSPWFCSTPFLLYPSPLGSPVLMLAVVTEAAVRARISLKLLRNGKNHFQTEVPRRWDKNPTEVPRRWDKNPFFSFSFSFSSAMWLQTWVKSQKVYGRVR